MTCATKIDLRQFCNLPIDWDLAPEDAVTLYLEWGNNNWHAEHPPVRSKEDTAIYFLIDTWSGEPILRLVQRNSEQAVDLAILPLPPEQTMLFRREYGDLKGIFEPLPAIKDWVRSQMFSESSEYK